MVPTSDVTVIIFSTPDKKQNINEQYRPKIYNMTNIELLCQINKSSHTFIFFIIDIPNLSAKQVTQMRRFL